MSNTTEKRIWGIHTRNESLFLNDNVIAIGWGELGDIGKFENSRDAFKEQYAATFPSHSKGKMAVCAGQLFRFVHEMNVGDYGGCIFNRVIGNNLHIKGEMSNGTIE